jgi:hypothetical protein
LLAPGQAIGEPHMLSYAEPVNPGETDRLGNYCAGMTSVG